MSLGQIWIETYKKKLKLDTPIVDLICQGNFLVVLGNSKLFFYEHVRSGSIELQQLKELDFPRKTQEHPQIALLSESSQTKGQLMIAVYAEKEIKIYLFKKHRKLVTA